MLTEDVPKGTLPPLWEILIEVLVIPRLVIMGTPIPPIVKLQIARLTTLIPKKPKTISFPT